MKKNTIAKLIYIVVMCVLILSLGDRECDSVIAAYVYLNTVVIFSTLIYLLM